LTSGDPSNPKRSALTVPHALAGLLVLLLGAVPASLRADESPGGSPAAASTAVTIEKVEVGFEGQFKVGEWAPLWVTVRSTSEREVTVVIDAPDADDNVTSLPSRPLLVKAGVPRRCEACFRTGRTSGELYIHLEDGRGERLASRRLRTGSTLDADLRPALRLNEPLWLLFGNVDLNFTGSAGRREPRVVRLRSPADLPADRQALQSIDLMVLPTSRGTGGETSLLDRISADDNAVLEDWVTGGGHLLISIAGEAESFRKSPLAKWVRPIVVEGHAPVRQLSNLEAFSGQNAPLKFSGTVTTARFEALSSLNVLLRHTGNPQPLAASVPHGFGRVTVVGVDIDAPPVATWKALPAVLQKLVGANQPRAREQVRSANRQLTHVGVSDLATQFQQTHEDFTTVSRPSYWRVMGLILLYVAVIGPVDYFLVQRVLRRPELTWFTLPVLVCGAVALAAWEANRLNARGLLVNQFDLIDIDSASGAVRGQTWVSLYSPEHRRYSVAVQPRRLGANSSPSPAPETQMTWMAPPENAVGGIYRSGTALVGRDYKFAASAASVENVPVAQWSTKSLSAVWHNRLDAPLVDCQLESFGAGQLKGTITHHLGVPLKDCLLVVNGWAFIPTTADATLESGRPWKPSGATVSQRDLQALLTGQKQARRGKEDALSSDSSTITTTVEPYNALNRNRAQQVAILSFHDVVGGTEYTGLANAALKDLELTSLMQLGRGVLIGRMPASPSKVLIDGSPSQTAGQSTWVRLVLPVVQSERVIEKISPRLNELPPPPGERAPNR
jgi:hypothetical protein